MENGNDRTGGSGVHAVIQHDTAHTEIQRIRWAVAGIQNPLHLVRSAIRFRVMFTIKRISYIVWLSLAIGLVSCRSIGKKDPAAMVELGRRFFGTPVEGGYACSDCHPNESSPAGRHFPAYSLQGVSNRRPLWTDYLVEHQRTVLNAALICHAKYQMLTLEDIEKRRTTSNAPLNLSDVMDEETAMNLDAYLRSLSDSSTSPTARADHPYDVLNKSARRDYLDRILRSTPDVEHGRTLFNAACAWCHGERGEGVDGKGQPMKLKPHKTDVIIEQIRYGGYRMPYFRADRLSDDDLADVVSYVSRLLAERSSR